MTKKLGFLAGAPRISTRPEAEMSGPRSRVLGVIKGFKQLGWEVDSFIVGDKVPKSWSAKGSEKALSSSYPKTLAVDIVRILLGVVNSFKAYKELNGKVDVVYEYSATLQCLGWIFKLFGVPWILQVEALLFYEAKADRNALVLDNLARWIEVWSYRNCDVIACVSQTLKEILISEFDICEEKIVLVPNGVDTDYMNPNGHSPKRLFSGFTIGFVGGLYSWTGLGLLLKAIASLKSEGYDFYLTIVGDGQTRSDLEREVAELDLSSRVTFVGRVLWEDVPSYIAGFDLAYSGQIELKMGKMYLSPMKLYEYMAMARPVIASRFEDSSNLISHNEIGFLFQPGDVEDLKLKLMHAYHSRDNLLGMGRKARQEIVSNHSWKAKVKSLSDRMTEENKLEVSW